MKFKNSNCDETQNSNCDQTQKFKLGQNSNCDQTQIVKKTQNHQKIVKFFHCCNIRVINICFFCIFFHYQFIFCLYLLPY